jgi:soluble lytic murein transglycosylase-like protein
LTAPESPRTAALPAGFVAADDAYLTFVDYKAVKHLRKYAVTHIDYELLQALIATESRFDAQAVSQKAQSG